MSSIERLYWEEEMVKVARKSGKKEARPSNSTNGGRCTAVWLPDCRHWRQPFELQDGLTIFASAWLDKPDHAGPLSPGGFSGHPDVGFYLDAKWASSTIVASPGAKLPFARAPRDRGQVVIYPWEDWGVPDNITGLRRALMWLQEQVHEGKVVEIGCMGGHGRTGTALACVLLLQGVNAKKAINRIWNSYCDEAIESQRQIEFINAFAKK